MDEKKPPPSKMAVNNYGCGSSFSLILAVFVLLFVFGELTRGCTGPPAQEHLAENGQPSGKRPGTMAAGNAQRHLGNKPGDFGTPGQAAALLQLLDDLPGRAEYRITYATDIDTVIFGLDINLDIIQRLHQRPDGTGTAERWTGHGLHRLQAAEKGGSLNQTPSGNSFGTYTKF